MSPANERQATPAASFDPDGIKKLLLRLFAAFRTLVFFWSNVPPGEARSPERGRGRGQPVHDGEGGVGAGFRLHRPFNSFDQPDSPSPSGLVYLLPASFERFPCLRAVVWAKHRQSSNTNSQIDGGSPLPSLRGAQGGEAEKKQLRINTVFFNGRGDFEIFLIFFL